MTAVGRRGELALGAVVRHLEIGPAWLVDPASGRSGAGRIVVEDGRLRSVAWLSGAEAADVDERGVVVAPGFIDLHAHFREPGNEDAETIATGQAAAAHGGFTTVCLMPNTEPPIDEPSVVARIEAAAAASGSPVRVLAYGAVSAGRAGEQLAALGELADAGVVGFSDDGAPIRSAALLRNALLYAGMAGLPVVDHVEDPALCAGAEAHEGLVATVLGLRGWPAAAEAAVVARDLAVLEAVVADEPRARLHFAHLSTRAAIELVRAAKARGLPVTCEVTPHHLAMSDEWVAGARRWAWEAVDARGAPRNPWLDDALVARPYATACKVNPPLRSADHAVACLAALADGTADALATDHAPHTIVDKEVEFGLAANGLSGIETALGVLLAAVDAGRISLERAIAALTVGPAGVLGERLGGTIGLRAGALADLVVFDRSARWQVGVESLRSKGHNTPLLGRELPGRVLVTIAGGQLAYVDESVEAAGAGEPDGEGSGAG
ncbi:MAG TPA: dihydroorotase [Candidatus Binatia bacterium]|nr:dihydroorotase [Candidatus Binatia bacterium]